MSRLQRNIMKVSVCGLVSILNILSVSYTHLDVYKRQAVRYVEKADIFVIIGTSLNVYPAAGLLHYVPRGAEVYLIDPKPVDTHTSRSIHVLRKGASEGVEELKQLLIPVP